MITAEKLRRPGAELAEARRYNRIFIIPGEKLKTITA